MVYKQGEILSITSFGKRFICELQKIDNKRLITFGCINMNDQTIHYNFIFDLDKSILQFANHEQRLSFMETFPSIELLQRMIQIYGV